MNRKLKIVLVALLVMLFSWRTLQAQLPQDVRDVFVGLIDDLDADLAEKFKAAIDNDTATVEFTPEQFRRFRDDPVNPFDGLDEINAVEGGGNIALKFELPSLRDRPVNRFERQHRSLRKICERQWVQLCPVPSVYSAARSRLPWVSSWKAVG